MRLTTVAADNINLFMGLNLEVVRLRAVRT